MATRLFSRPEPYTAHVPLRLIKPVQHGSRSATKRSIEAFGMLSLPVLREIIHLEEAPADAYRYTIVDGVRRIEDLRSEAGDDGSVLAMILPAEVGEDAADAISLAMNYDRTENPGIEAQKLARLRDAGHDVDELAAKLGISRSKVRQRLLLHDHLGAVAFDALLGGHIPTGVASRLARLDASTRDAIVERWQSGEIDKITHDIISAAQADARDQVTRQLPTLEASAADASGGPLTAARVYLRNALATGISAKQLHMILDDEAGDADDA